MDKRPPFALHDRLDQRREALAKWGRHVKTVVDSDGNLREPL
jgi:hypothetical protein